MARAAIAAWQVTITNAFRCSRGARKCKLRLVSFISGTAARMTIERVDILRSSEMIREWAQGFLGSRWSIGSFLCTVPPKFWLCQCDYLVAFFTRKFCTSRFLSQ